MIADVNAANATNFEDVPLEWIQLNLHPNYDISTTAPHQIRNHTTLTVLQQTLSNMGYYQITIERKTYTIHRLIAEQFIHNDDPEHNTDVDHIDRNRLNNTIENLRWVSHGENQANRAPYGKKESEWVKVDDINPEDMFQLGRLWDNIPFSRYYYNASMDKLLMRQNTKKRGEVYKIVKPIMQGKDGSMLTVTLISDIKVKKSKDKTITKTYTRSYTKLIEYFKDREDLDN